MANWVYPLGTAAQGNWDISLGTSDSTVEVEGWAHTGLKVATLGASAAVELPAADEERIIIPLNGSFTVAVDGGEYRLAGRTNVFSGPSDVLYTGTGKAATISSADGGRVAVATAPAKASYPTRLITAAETPVELRGAGNCSRQVHNFGTPAALEADRFIVCEVLTPGGNWSSYPPHKHDEEKDGETSLEEIYYFETRVTPAPRPGRSRTTRSAISACTPRTIVPSMSPRRCGPATSSWCPMAGTARPWRLRAMTCTTSM